MTTETLIEEIRKLPPDQKQVVRDFILRDDEESSKGRSLSTVMELAGCLKSDIQFTSFQDEKEEASKAWTDVKL